jgi:hypothetical protein
MSNADLMFAADDLRLSGVDDLPLCCRLTVFPDGTRPTQSVPSGQPIRDMVICCVSLVTGELCANVSRWTSFATLASSPN